MIVHFSKELVEKIIYDESIVYAQIPFINYAYVEIEYESEHLLTLEINKKKIIDSKFYFEGYYPFYRNRDLNMLLFLLRNC